MVKQQSFLCKLLFVFTIVPVIFQDLPLSDSIGTIARTPVFIIAPIIFCIILLKEQKLFLHTIPKYYLIYFGFTVFTSVIMMLITVLCFTNGTWNLYGEFFPIKLLKASQYTFFFFLFAYNAYTLIQKLSLQFVLHVLQLTFFALVIYGVFEFFIPYPLQIIHATIVEEWKIRFVLTGPEPSTTMLLFACIAFSTIALRMYLNKNVIITIIIAILTLTMLLAIASKSGVVFIVLSLLWVLRKNFTLKYFLISILITVPIVFYFINVILPELLSDIEGFTSFSTRTTTMLVAVKSLFIFPLGQGYGSYIVHFPKMLLPMNAFLSKVLQLPLMTYELEDMVSSGRYLGVKSGILQEVLYNGIAAIVFFYFVFKQYFGNIKRLSQKNLKTFLSFTGVFCFLELLLTTELLTAYYFLFPFLLVYKITNLKESKT